MTLMALPQDAMKCAIFLGFLGSKRIADPCISSQLDLSNLRSKLCDQSTTHDEMQSYSPVVFIAAMAYRIFILEV